MNWTASEAAEEAAGAMRPPIMEAPYCCPACDDFEYAVNEDDPDTTCPICGRPGERL